LLVCCCRQQENSKGTARKQQENSRKSGCGRRKAWAPLPERMTKKKDLPDLLMTDFLLKKYFLG